MTKKDYELIASVFRDSSRFNAPKVDKLTYNNGAVDKWDTLARNLGTKLAQNDPKFDRSKFLRACGLEA